MCSQNAMPPPDIVIEHAERQQRANAIDDDADVRPVDARARHTWAGGHAAAHAPPGRHVALGALSLVLAHALIARRLFACRCARRRRRTTWSSRAHGSSSRCSTTSSSSRRERRAHSLHWTYVILNYVVCVHSDQASPPLPPHPTQPSMPALRPSYTQLSQRARVCHPLTPRYRTLTTNCDHVKYRVTGNARTLAIQNAHTCRRIVSQHCMRS